ncbi:serine/threonine-protein kinase [Sorangium sp. So ce1128]
MPYPGLHVTPHIRLARPLGQGGMSSVWVAEHLGLRTQIVVKFLNETFAKSPEMVARFQREAALASQVKSPHVVQMIDHGLAPDGVPYIAMELLEGRDLRHLLAERAPLPPHEVVAIVWQVAKALGRAHERGVVHRDIKPDNIFLCDVGHGEAFVKVLDFGIAKIGETGDLAATRTGVTLGTPYYMSPEQVVGSRVDARTDLWSLGVVTYECLTGRRPFDEQTIGAQSIAICQGEITPPTRLNPSLPPSVDAWFLRACARSPGARFSTARELADELARALQGPSAAADLRVGSAPFGPPPVDTWPRGGPPHASTPPYVSTPPHPSMPPHASTPLHLAAGRPALTPASAAPAVTALGTGATMRSASSASISPGRVLVPLAVLGAIVALGAAAFVLRARGGGEGAASSASAEAGAGVAGTATTAAAAIQPADAQAPAPASAPGPGLPGAPSAAPPGSAAAPGDSATAPAGSATAPGGSATASADAGGAAAPPPGASAAPGGAAARGAASPPRPRAPGVPASSTTKPPPKKKRDIDIR